MRKIYLLTLMSIILFNCQKKTELRTDLQPIYSDSKNALQGNNLYGKVKKIEYYKTTFQNIENEDKPVLNKIEEYTDFGELKKVEYFDNYGELTQTNDIDYNKNQEFIKSVSINKSNESNIIQISEYDTIKNTSELSVFVNDTIDHKTTFYYGKNDYQIKRISIKGNDTTEVNLEYVFDDNDKIISSTQKEKGNDKSMTTNLFKYDNNNNLIESSYKTEWMEMISETEWKDGRIFKQTSYTISADLKKHTNNITEFDILYNPINSKEFDDSKLNRELKFDYEFDKNGNWIKKNVSLKEHFNNSKGFVPIYVDTRKISYWK
ncbi:hypothetical protein SAMN05216503_2023 [Polaribacter sp. KT25b]|uniref:hypothetical protein n=1 Tax=Polaribacter sp. KT25b TaxID=1855336 RepID=UPI00087A5CE4|nr:hypothetical protein [Polaribacter sp. KT25b]SDS11601.1 hypothetical protein SAMN05216503_2023 [Polaribacter sp. KT25b]